MPASSEGYEDTGLPPNPAVSKDQLDPAKFDPQTTEIFFNRVNKALRTDFKTIDTLCVHLKMLADEPQWRAAIVEAWQYLHKKFPGLKNGHQSTWGPAIDELAESFQAQSRILNEFRHGNVDLRAQLNNKPDELLTERAKTLEMVPGIEARLNHLEARLNHLERWFWQLVGAVAGDSPVRSATCLLQEKNAVEAIKNA